MTNDILCNIHIIIILPPIKQRTNVQHNFESKKREKEIPTQHHVREMRLLAGKEE